MPNIDSLPTKALAATDYLIVQGQGSSTSRAKIDADAIAGLGLADNETFINGLVANEAFITALLDKLPVVSTESNGLAPKIPEG